MKALLLLTAQLVQTYWLKRLLYGRRLQSGLLARVFLLEELT